MPSDPAHPSAKPAQPDVPPSADVSDQETQSADDEGSSEAQVEDLAPSLPEEGATSSHGLPEELDGTDDPDVPDPAEEEAEEEGERAPAIVELRPHDDYVWLQSWISRATGGLVVLVLAGATWIVAAAGASWVATQILLPIDLMIGAATAWIVWHWPKLVRQNFLYRIQADEGVEAHRGLWWRVVRFVPRSRIQHAGILQGPIERHLGLATVAIHTAGSRASKTRLPGLTHERALALAKELTTTPSSEDVTTADGSP